MQPETPRTPQTARRTPRAALLALCLAGAAAVPLALTAPAHAAASTAATGADVAGTALDSPHTPSDPGAQLTTSMMPADSPDAVAARRAEAAAPSAARAAVRANAVEGNAVQAAATPAYAEGIDVASYQHPSGKPITWASVRASGRTFAVIKATESTTYTNTYMAQDAAGARAAGITVGVYHFARPSLVNGSPTADAVAEADHFAAQVKAVGGAQLPPTLDLEVNGGLTPRQLTSWTGSVLGRVQSDTGRRPMIYTGPYFWNDDVQSGSFGAYPLWEAHYTTAATPAAVKGWSTWALWQYTDGSYGSPAAVPGVGGSYVDRDRVHGSTASLAALTSGCSDCYSPFTGSASASDLPDGTYVRVVGTAPVYLVAGRAPLYLPSWADAPAGTRDHVRTVSSAQFATLRSRPADGTFLRSPEDGAVYRVAGGAPVFLNTLSPFPGARPLEVAASTIANAGRGEVYNHLLVRPEDGTFIGDPYTGGVYRVAGGAPVAVSSWAYFGAPQPVTTVSNYAIAGAGRPGLLSHLLFHPVAGTVVKAGIAGTTFTVQPDGRILGGGSSTNAVVEGDSAIANHGKPGVWAHLG